VRAYASAATKTALFNFHHTANGSSGANFCRDLTGEKLAKGKLKNRRSLRHRRGEAIQNAFSHLPTPALMGQEWCNASGLTSKISQPMQ
jgi:hypothetical protein